MDFSALPALKNTFYSSLKTKNVGIHIFSLLESSNLAENSKKL